MYKFKITSFLLLIIFFLNSCGFTPEYSGFKGLDFSIKIDETNGDRDLNNAIKSLLNRYDIDDPQLNSINVKIVTKFTKDTLSKDSTGKATKYNLKAKVKFFLNSKQSSRTVTFIEEFKIDNIEDTVEENNYIRIIKRNFAEIISEKLILNINQN